MDDRLYSRRYCRWRPHRIPDAMRADAVYCSKRCRQAAARARRRAGLDPQAEADRVEASPAWRRQESEGALLRLADEAIEVIADALAEKDTSVAEWIVERAVVRHSKPGSPLEKSPRMSDEEAKAALERAIAAAEAELEEEQLEERRDEERRDEENASRGWPWKRSASSDESASSGEFEREPGRAAPSWLAFG